MRAALLMILVWGAFAGGFNNVSTKKEALGNVQTETELNQNLATQKLFQDTENLHEIDPQNYQKSIQNAGTTWIAVEFFNPKCPICQKLYPTVRTTADGLADHVTFFTMNCLANSCLCDAMKVHDYPTIFLGKANEFTMAAITAKRVETTGDDLENQMRKITQTPNAPDGVLEQAAAAQTESTTNTPDVFTHASREDLVKVTHSVYTEFTAAKQCPSGISKEKQKAFADLANVLSFSHPVDECRTTFSVISSELAPPKARSLGSAKDTQYDFCGYQKETLQNVDYVQCKGTTAYLRGYSCGLWQLFHSVLVHSQDGKETFRKFRNFLKHWFACGECIENFMLETKDFESDIEGNNRNLGKWTGSGIMHNRSAVLYLWTKHNQINKRLAKEEAQRYHDPNFPKIQWPPKSLCSDCYNERSEFDEDKVFSFLQRFYN